MFWVRERKNSPRRLAAQVSLRMLLLLMLAAAVFFAGWTLGTRRWQAAQARALAAERALQRAQMDLYLQKVDLLLQQTSAELLASTDESRVREALLRKAEAYYQGLAETDEPEP